MNKIMLCALLLSGGLHNAIQAQRAMPVTISGHISSDKDSTRLIARFCEDPVIGYGESKKIDVPVKNDGSFSFSTPPISGLARLTFFDGHTGNQLFQQEQQIIAPGDQVQLFGNIHDKGEPYYFKAVFFGKGAAKFECIQALKAIDVRMPYKTTEKILHLYDSLLNRKQKIVRSFGDRLSKNEYALIQADMEGELKSGALMNVCGFRFGSHGAKPDAAELAQKKQLFDALMAHFGDDAVNTEVIMQSVTYRNYLFEKTKASLVFESKGTPVSLTRLFEKLREQHDGALREKLLGKLFLSSQENFHFFGGIDPQEHINCLQEAYTLIKLPELKERFKQQLDARAKGAPAFNFYLPVDSSATKKLSLSDLKGKVVLLDLWAYQCGGCMMFSQTFHKKIYPVFRDNPDFVVASIMLGESSKAAYMRRLRSEGGAVYTFSDYINLFGGKGIASARQMESYHNINSFPTLLLLDKQGKIYSSTLPVIYGDPRNKELEKNAGKLTELIKQALAEPGHSK